MSPVEGLLFLRVGSTLARPVATIRRIRATAADFPAVADAHEPDHWQLVNRLLYVQVNPESGRWRYAGPVFYREVRPSALLVDLWTQIGELYASMGAHGKAKRAVWLARTASEALDDPWARAEVGMLLVRLGSSTRRRRLQENGRLSFCSGSWRWHVARKTGHLSSPPSSVLRYAQLASGCGCVLRAAEGLAGKARELGAHPSGACQARRIFCSSLDSDVSLHQRAETRKLGPCSVTRRSNISKRSSTHRAAADVQLRLAKAGDRR